VKEPAFQVQPVNISKFECFVNNGGDSVILSKY